MSPQGPRQDVLVPVVAIDAPDVRFSIVVPVRNEGDRVVGLVTSLLAQDYPRHLVEILAVDGHSTDGTRECIEAFGLEVLLDGGWSAAEARNRGILAATGDVVAFIDGDCRADAGWLRALAEAFRDPTVAGVGGGIATGNAERPWALVEHVESAAHYRGFITANVAYRRRVLLELGGLDPELQCGEDWDLWWRALDAGHRIVFRPDALVYHEPVELEGFLAYVRKQLWYARQDARLFRGRVGSTLRRLRAGERVALREPLRIASPAALHAAVVLGLAIGLRAPAARRAAVGLLALWIGHRTVRALGDALPPRRAPEYVAFTALKSLVRGYGTLLGVIDGAVDRWRGPTGEARPAPRAPEPRARSARRRRARAARSM